VVGITGEVIWVRNKESERIKWIKKDLKVFTPTTLSELGFIRQQEKKEEVDAIKRSSADLLKTVEALRSKVDKECGQGPILRNSISAEKFSDQFIYRKTEF
jgi:hypothetical protein